VLTDEYVPQGLALLEKELKLHPKSATHWWLYGRAHRSQRRLRRSGEAFATAARGGVDFVQIVHVNYYELGFNCLFGQRWADARCFFEVLLRDNTWSRALYAYVLAVCEAMCGNQAKADEYYAAAPSYIDRTYGGRVLSVEQFVQRRSAAHKSRTTGSARLDAIELCYLWNGFPQTPFKVLAKFLSMVEDSEDALLNDLEGPKFHGKSPPTIMMMRMVVLQRHRRRFVVGVVRHHRHRRLAQRRWQCCLCTRSCLAASASLTLIRCVRAPSRRTAAPI
jgi:hypothetical protein